MMLYSIYSPLPFSSGKQSLKKFNESSALSLDAHWGHIGADAT